MFGIGKKKPLQDADPKALDLDTLSHLHAGLIAKLLLANEELYARLEKLGAAAKDMKWSEEQRKIFSSKAMTLRGFNKILTQVLADSLGK